MNPVRKLQPEAPNTVVSFLPSVMPGEFSTDAVHEPLWRQLGADRCRAVLLDLATQEALVWRWMRDGGVSSGQGDEQPMEQILPGADVLLTHWTDATATEPGTVITHMLSPRRWVYFWRIDERHGALVQMHFLTGRSSSHEFDTAGVRVITEHWLAGELRAVPEHAPAPAWDRSERRARLPASLASRATLIALLVCSLLGLWSATLGGGALAQDFEGAQLEHARLARLANDAMQRHLGLAMAGNDYGQAQDVLSLHKALEHFGAAAVTNPRGLVVAHAGFSPGLVVGAAVPAELIPRMQALPLTAGPAVLGQVFMQAGPDSRPQPQGNQLLWWRLAAGLCAAGAAAGAAMLWRQQFARARR